MNIAISIQKQEVYDNNRYELNVNITASNFFKFEARITGQTPAAAIPLMVIQKDVEIAVPLEYSVISG